MDIRLRLNRTHPGTPGCMRHPRWGACNSEIIINPSLTNFTSSNPYAPPMEVKKSEKGRFRVDRFLQGGLGERLHFQNHRQDHRTFAGFLIHMTAEGDADFLLHHAPVGHLLGA